MFSKMVSKCAFHEEIVVNANGLQHVVGPGKKNSKTRTKTAE